MGDKWAEYKKQFCGCKDGSRLNSCKGLPNCSLRSDHPERKSAAPVVERQDLIAPYDAIFHAISAAVDVRSRTSIAISVKDFQASLAANGYSVSPPAPVAVVLPRYTCIGKGGEYELLGSAIGAGTLKDMSAIPVYRDTTTGQLFVRTPLDFATRMDCLDKVKEMNR